MNTRFSVHMDLKSFRDIVAAQLVPLWRGVGILLVITCSPMALLSIFTFDISDLADPAGLGLPLLSLIAVACGIAMLFGKPLVGLKTRGPLVRSWFAMHGATVGQGSTLSMFYDKDIESLTCDYNVELGNYGFSQTSASGTLNVPWFALSGHAHNLRTGVVFTMDNGKNDSPLYNLIGNNYLFRDERVDASLYIPHEVAKRQPNLVRSVKHAVRQARATVASDEGRRQLAANQDFIRWLAQSSLVNLGSERSKEQHEPVAAGTPLTEIRFLPSELFTLMGGVDTARYVCTPPKLALDEAASPLTRETWKQDMIRRLGPSGWVDQNGVPRAELARAAAALGQAGYAVCGCQSGRVRLFTITWGSLGTVALEQAVPDDYTRGWRFANLDADPANLPASALGFITAHLHPFIPAPFDYYAQFTGKSALEFSQVVIKGNERRIAKRGAELGIPQQALDILKSWMSRAGFVDSYFLWDFSACTPDTSHGFRDFASGAGPRRQALVLIDNNDGMLMRRSFVWHPGVTTDYATSELQNAFREQSCVVEVFMRSKPDISDILTTIPPYPAGA